MDTNRLVYGYCGYIISLNLFNPITDKIFQYYILDISGSWSLYACLTSLCNTQSYMMKIYNDNSTCEQNMAKTKSLAYPISNWVQSVTKCYFCIHCNFTTPGVVKVCKTASPFQSKFSCTVINFSLI